jgi:hypothetical protein
MAILVYFVVIWYIFPRFGILDQEKSGNHGSDFGFVSLLVKDRAFFRWNTVFDSPRNIEISELEGECLGSEKWTLSLLKQGKLKVGVVPAETRLLTTKKYVLCLLNGVV